jgi:hypothetical protein
MKSPSFNANLIDHLSRRDHSYQEKLALMADKLSQDSTLLLSCFAGDSDITRWILKHTVDDSCNSIKLALKEGDFIFLFLKTASTLPSDQSLNILLMYISICSSVIKMVYVMSSVLLSLEM